MGLLIAPALVVFFFVRAVTMAEYMNKQQAQFWIVIFGQGAFIKKNKFQFGPATAFRFGIEIKILIRGQHVAEEIALRLVRPVTVAANRPAVLQVQSGEVFFCDVFKLIADMALERLG